MGGSGNPSTVEWPKIPDGGIGSYSGYDCPIVAPQGDCFCFTQTGWYQSVGPEACVYPHRPSQMVKSVPSAQKVAWGADAGLLDIDGRGNLYLPIGEVYAEGTTPPSGDVEYVLVTCDSQVKAKLIIEEESGIPIKADLWIAGRVVVAYTPSGTSTCGSTFLNEDSDIVVGIDSEGNLIAQGLVYVEGKVLRDVYNWPYNPGGATLYE